MEGIYSQSYTISDIHVDCFSRLKPSMILLMAQEVAGAHFNRIAMDYQSLAQKGMFWAVSRHKVQITRLPSLDETIRVETWPMPATRVAYPRSVVAYDEAGNEVFRAITLWVLLDIQTRALVLPGRSGVDVPGMLTGSELASPLGLPAKTFGSSLQRRVCFSDLDRNGHMNNTRCLDWMTDLLPAAFHSGHPVKEFIVCYIHEAREAEELRLNWELTQQGDLVLEATRSDGERVDRIFAAKLAFA